MNATLLALCSLPLLLAAAPEDEVPVDGARGLGDPYYPDLGNGGYDVGHYALELAVDPVANHLDGTATIDATAEVALRSFHLELRGLEVAPVTVYGEPAAFERHGQELVITPARPLRRGQAFRTVVRYSGNPESRPEVGVPIPSGIGWLHFEDRVFAVSEPSGSMTWYPVNDHPRDKATYELVVTVPEGYVAATNGRLLGSEEADDGGRTFRFRASDPMASYLATLNVAPFVVIEDEGPGGIPLTFYVPEDAPLEARSDFDRTGELLEALSEWFGPYPFESFGGVIMNQGFGAALETQTLPVYGGERARLGTQVHELAHQWFGNHVSIDTWQDLWLSESFASYASWLWQERTEGREALDASLPRRYALLARRGSQAPGDPGAERLFGIGVYLRGPMALHALRLEIGDEAFFGTLRTWCERFGGGTATTPDFVALAEEKSGRELDAFFEGWLHAPEVPDVPQASLERAQFLVPEEGEGDGDRGR